ncbi:MAG: hypothetical protein K2X99_11965 [Gemmatimonadaceae bacterium]|nr:hypothetical protein [Gemmatimonadaceae bacterium]
MVATELPTNASLAELLSARAQRTPRERLALDVIGGVLILVAAVWARPGGWLMVAAAAGCFAAYGVWAFAELRTLADDADPASDLWHVVQGAAAAIGLGAFGLLLLTALGIAIGPIIS